MYRQIATCFRAAIIAILISNTVQASASITLSVIPNDPVDALAFSIVKEAYRRIGITALAMYLPSKRAILAADTGNTDGDVIRIEGMEKEYPHLVRVPEPVISVDTYAFTTQAGTIDINGWSSLRNYEVCIRQGIFLQEAKTNELNVSHVSTIADAIKMLTAKRCDIATLSKWAWLDIASMQVQGIRQLQPALATNRMYHYVNIKNANLLAPLALALQQMKADGTLQMLESKDNEAIKQAILDNAQLKISKAHAVPAN